VDDRARDEYKHRRKQDRHYQCGQACHDPPYN
jgi:hypothetical protein